MLNIKTETDMKTYTMTLKNYVENFVSTFDSGFSDFETKEEEVFFLMKRKDIRESFIKFTSSFCDKKNLMNKGVYTFVSCDGNNFIYTIS